MRVRLISTHVRATPLRRMDHACQTRNKKVSGQLAGVSRFTCGEIDPGIRYIGTFGCGEEPVLLLLLLLLLLVVVVVVVVIVHPGIIHSLSNLMGKCRL